MTNPNIELASAGRRLAAFVLNMLFTLIALIPILLLVLDLIMRLGLSSILPVTRDNFVLYASVAGGVLLIYVVWQIYLMSCYGQSMGKRLLGLRVVKTDGSAAGFVHVVFLREVVPYLLIHVACMVVSMMALMVTQNYEMVMLGDILPWACYALACVIMLFTHAKRRTLYDLFANTVVIQLPR